MSVFVSYIYKKHPDTIEDSWATSISNIHVITETHISF